MLNFLNSVRNFIEMLNSEIKIKIIEDKVIYCLEIKLRRGVTTHTIYLDMYKDKWKKYSSIEEFKLYLVRQIIQEILLLYACEE